MRVTVTPAAFEARSGSRIRVKVLVTTTHSDSVRLVFDAPGVKLSAPTVQIELTPGPGRKRFRGSVVHTMVVECEPDHEGELLITATNAAESASARVRLTIRA